MINWNHDYWRDYGHSYIGVKKHPSDKTVGVFSVEKVDSSGKGQPSDENNVALLGNAYFSSAKGWEPAHIKPVESIKNGTMIPYPTLGVVNDKYFAHYLSRKPYRQWCKGYSPSLVSDFVFISGIVSKLSIPLPRGLNIKFLLSLYNPMYYSLEKALDKVKKGEMLSAGFSPDLQFYVTENSGQHVFIGYKRFHIGQLKTIKQKALIVPEAEFLAEDLAQMGLECEFATS